MLSFALAATPEHHRDTAFSKIVKDIESSSSPFLISECTPAITFLTHHCSSKIRKEMLRDVVESCHSRNGRLPVDFLVHVVTEFAKAPSVASNEFIGDVCIWVEDQFNGSDQKRFCEALILAAMEREYKASFPRYVFENAARNPSFSFCMHVLAPKGFDVLPRCFTKSVLESTLAMFDSITVSKRPAFIAQLCRRTLAIAIRLGDAESIKLSLENYFTTGSQIPPAMLLHSLKILPKDDLVEIAKMIPKHQQLDVAILFFIIRAAISVGDRDTLRVIMEIIDDRKINLNKERCLELVKCALDPLHSVSDSSNVDDVRARTQIALQLLVALAKSSRDLNLAERFIVPIANAIAVVGDIDGFGILWEIMDSLGVCPGSIVLNLGVLCVIRNGEQRKLLPADIAAQVTRALKGSFMQSSKAKPDIWALNQAVHTFGKSEMPLQEALRIVEEFEKECIVDRDVVTLTGLLACCRTLQEVKHVEQMLDLDDPDDVWKKALVRAYCAVEEPFLADKTMVGLENETDLEMLIVEAWAKKGRYDLVKHRLDGKINGRRKRNDVSRRRIEAILVSLYHADFIHNKKPLFDFWMDRMKDWKVDDSATITRMRLLLLGSMAIAQRSCPNDVLAFIHDHIRRTESEDWSIQSVVYTALIEIATTFIIQEAELGISIPTNAVYQDLLSISMQLCQRLLSGQDFIDSTIIKSIMIALAWSEGRPAELEAWADTLRRNKSTEWKFVLDLCTVIVSLRANHIERAEVVALASCPETISPFDTNASTKMKRVCYTEMWLLMATFWMKGIEQYTSEDNCNRVRLKALECLERISPQDFNEKCVDMLIGICLHGKSSWAAEVFKIFEWIAGHWVDDGGILAKFLARPWFGPPFLSDEACTLCLESCTAVEELDILWARICQSLIDRGGPGPVLYVALLIRFAELEAWKKFTEVCVLLMGEHDGNTPQSLNKKLRVDGKLIIRKVLGALHFKSSYVAEKARRAVRANFFTLF
ncbi:hypothetical protein HDU97_005513 [Phlyctochytrium planicorne]|nr:hypothetical protein HDU97_005513 [Phlyctochytrium planicorne]